MDKELEELTHMPSYKQSKLEHIINTDDSRKNELQKCCTGEKCNSKPPFLQIGSCVEHKDTAAGVLDKSYDQMFSQDEYNTILTDLKIRPNIDNTKIERSNKEINLQIRKINDNRDKIGTTSYNKILLDNTDNVTGFDNNNIYASYKKK